MARIDLVIPSLGDKFKDSRDSLPGDSFNWSWIRPLSQVNYLAIHHSASPDNQSVEEIANYHISNNGWGGIGYHFVVAKNGDVFYVGDISTARANVANMNEQVIGICLVGNFTSGRSPSNEQLDSTHALCDFFINNYPDLSNVNSWEAIAGHKELPGQSTACPGDTWSSWRSEIIKGPPTSPSTDRSAEISVLQDQVKNLQASLSSVNQQVFNLQAVVQEKDQQINDLRMVSSSPSEAESIPQRQRVDTSLTIVEALVNLYKFIFMSRKADAIGSS